MSKTQKNAQPQTIDGVFPNSVELEEIVLGALILEPRAIERIELLADDFYKAEHAMVYQSIVDLNNLKIPIDMFTVSDRLTSRGQLESVGGPYFIVALTAKVSSSAHLETHALIIKQKSDLRKLIYLSREIQDKAYSDESIDEINEYFDSKFTDIKTGNSKCESKDINTSIEEAIKIYQETQVNRNKGIDLTIKTGLSDLDKSLNGGWSSPDLIVIGGRPSMGKTQFSLLFAKSAAKSKYVEFVSLEMTSTQLITRFITENESVNFYNIKTGNLQQHEWQCIDNEINAISKLKLSISDNNSIEYLPNIVSLLRKKKRAGKLDIAIIDYLQLIRTHGNFRSRQLEVAHITRTLKSLARELGIPIIILAQLGRPKDGMKADTPPQLHELREAGDIEQDADIVLFIHRPFYYGITSSSVDGRSWENAGFLIKAKHREGIKDERIYFKHDKSFKKIIGENESFDNTFINVNNNIEPNTNFLNETQNEYTIPF